MSITVLSDVMEHSKQSGSALLVLQAIAWRADDAGYAYPSIGWIATKARLKERATRRLIQKLAQDGELAVETGKGEHGTNRYRVTVTPARQLSLLEGGPDDREGQQTPQRAEPSGRAATPANTSVPLSSSSPSGTDESGGLPYREGRAAPSYKEQAAAPPRLTPRREAKRIEEEAVALWLRERKRTGRVRFTEASAIRGLRIALRRALARGLDWLDIATALTLKAGETNANPWYADEWTAVAKAAREDREQAARAAESRRSDATARNQEGDTEWAELEAQHPGLSRAQIAERVAFSGVLKRMPADRSERSADTPASRPVAANVVRIFGPRGEQHTWAGGRSDSSEEVGPSVLSREPAQGPAKLGTGGSDEPVTSQVTEWPEVIGPERIPLIPGDFHCSATPRCPRKGSRWVRLAPDADPIPICRDCFDAALPPRREVVG